MRNAISSHTNRRRVVLQGAASAAALTSLPHAAFARRKQADTSPPKCYDSNFKEVPCAGSVEADDSSAALATNSAATGGKKLDPNNYVASDYSYFPGLYPTIGGKLFKRAQNYPFTSKQQVYDALDTDQERKVLKAYDADIIIKTQDLNAIAAKIATN